MENAQRGEVSVVVPTKNRHDFVGRTVCSLLVSPLVREVIVVDDGSDDPVSIVDPRVIISRHDHSLGEGAAVNSGWRLATGKYLLVISDDDPQRPDLVDSLVNAARRYPEAIAWYPQTLEVSASGPRRLIPASPLTPRQILKRLRIPCLAGVLINAEELRSRGLECLRNESVAYPNDTLQWLSLSLLGNFVPVSQATALWWRHEGQVSTSWPGECKARSYAENVGNWLLQHPIEVPTHAFGALFVRVLQCMPISQYSSYLNAWRWTWPIARERNLSLLQFSVGITTSICETFRYRLSHK